MSLYAIADLHLALSVDKSMDVFGPEWDNYMDKIRENWCKKIKHDDYVILAGDTSWATYIEQAYDDFKYLDSLPGVKIILKGNHDYWWTTLTKLNNYIEENEFKKIVFLHNNCIVYNEIAICGTRGWLCPDAEGFSNEDEKIYLRELNRLEISIKQGIKYNPREIIAVLHYPPAYWHGNMESGFIDIFNKYNIRTCIYGHLHGENKSCGIEGEYNGIRYFLVSSDSIGFSPIKITD